MRSPGAHEKFFLRAYMESSTTHKIRKNGRRDFVLKPIFLFLYPVFISKESLKNNEVGLGYRVWGRAPAGEGGGGGTLAQLINACIC